MKTDLAIGERVRVQVNGGERFGTLLKWNPKTAVVRLDAHVDAHGLRPAKTIDRHHADVS